MLESHKMLESLKIGREYGIRVKVSFNTNPNPNPNLTGRPAGAQFIFYLRDIYESWDTQYRLFEVCAWPFSSVCLEK